MAFITCNYQSAVLGTSVSIHIILPEPEIGHPLDRKFPTLYLLHGIADDHTGWIRRSAIERYVHGLKLAVVMPYVSRSFYADMVHGLQYWTYLSDELPGVMRAYFPLSDKREDNFAAGFSMGGYGAIKWALRHPDRFAAAAGLSSVTDIASGIARWPKDFANIFGKGARLENSQHDLFGLAARAAESERTLPKLFLSCGTEDYLYEDNVRFRDFCRTLPFEFTYEERPGTHNWDYWDGNIERVIRWLPLHGQ